MTSYQIIALAVLAGAAFLLLIVPRFFDWWRNRPTSAARALKERLALAACVYKLVDYCEAGGYADEAAMLRGRILPTTAGRVHDDDS